MKMTERSVWIIAVLAIAGWSLFGRERAGQGSPASDPAPSSAVSRNRGISPDGDLSGQKGRSGRRGLHDGDAGEQSKKALSLTDPLNRLSAFLMILAAADADRLDRVATSFDEMKAAGLSLSAEEELLHFRIGQLKGAESMAGHTGLPDDFERLGILKKQYEGWIQADPQAAGKWLDTLPLGKYRDQMTVAYIAACAKDDPAGSLGLIPSLHPSQQAQAGIAAAKQLAKSSTPDEASALFRSLGSGAGASDVRYLSAMFDAFVTSSSNDGVALSLIEKDLNETYVTGSTLTNASEANARSHPEATLRWAVSLAGKKNDLPEGDVVAAAIRGMTLEGLESAKQWAGTQQEGASYWLEMIDRRREILEERRGEENEYDKDD